MDLEAWRTERKLIYRDLADLIGASSPAKARAYALGEAWPRPEQLERIRQRCVGVDLYQMHQKRLQWVREHKVAPDFDAPTVDDVDLSTAIGSDSVPTAESRP